MSAEKYCEAPPLVLNATLTMNAELRSAAFTCWPGYRFSDGSSVKVKECNHDNSWNFDIGSCAGRYGLEDNENRSEFSLPNEIFKILW